MSIGYQSIAGSHGVFNGNMNKKNKMELFCQWWGYSFSPIGCPESLKSWNTTKHEKMPDMPKREKGVVGAQFRAVQPLSPKYSVCVCTFCLSSPHPWWLNVKDIVLHVHHLPLLPAKAKHYLIFKLKKLKSNR